MSQQRKLAVVTAVFAGVVGAVLLAKGCFGEASNQASNPAPSASANTEQQANAAGPSAMPPPGADEAVMQKLTSVAHLQQVLSDYKSAAIYPPWSRPHDEGTRYKLEWNKPSVSDLPLATDTDHPTHYRFASDKAHVMYGETLTSWIEAWEGDDDTKRVPIKVSQAFVMAVGGEKEGRVVSLEYKDDGSLRFVNKLVPSQIPELQKALQVRLSAVIEQGAARRVVVREFTYAPKQLVTFNAIGDAIKDGNLVVSLDVDVLEKGTYTFEGNIMSGDGKTPIGWYQEDRQLEAGKQLVECRALGKIFTDKGIDGPYLIKDIRGIQRPMNTGELPIPFLYDGTHTTKAYKTVDFSNKEWDAPEKRDKIAGLEKLIADTKSGKVGQPTDQPQHIHIDENGKTTIVK